MILWLHFRTLRRNMRLLQQHLVRHPPAVPGGPVRLDASGYSFQLCGHCVDAVISAGR